ncbi:Trehalose-phosphatase [Sesbania bispinosa]|nr:Trehalose-phosphatase [Sesbania bispinosa]
MGYLPEQSTDSDLKSPLTPMPDENRESILCAYASWLEKHPSALDNFEEMMSIAKGKNIVVFLDYDGTLSPIVDDPDQAYMSDAMRAAVREVASCFPTAIVSGRRRSKVYEFVKLRNVYYAGSHGMDISTPLGSSKCEDQKHQIKSVDEKGNHVVLFHPAKEFLATIQEIIKVLKEKTKRIKGSMVEDNMFCVSVHYRRVKKEEDVGVLREIVESIMKDYPNFHISGGKKVMEIRPDVNWDKGRALMYLLGTLGFDTSNDVLPIYLGDDRTDEDAFKQNGRRTSNRREN